MTVNLIPPSPGDTRSAFADWMEIQALVSPRARATSSTLSNVLDIAEDEAAESGRTDEESGEILDRSILEEGRSELEAATFEELEYRATALGSAYPFIVTTNSGRLTLDHKHDSDAIDGNAVYLFCLLASVMREKKLQPIANVGEAEKEIANTFQICACLAAGGYLKGDVSSFGFPRATNTAFLPALRNTYDRFGSGRVRSEIPDGMPESLKDGGVDVISWRNNPDGMPGKLYMIGQCASGKNWQSKSVVEYIPQLHGSWFTEQPATHFIPAMFIPFTFHRDIDEARRGAYLEAVKNSYWHYEKRFGIIFDRLRIAHFACSCLNFDASARERVDGFERLGKIQEWVATAIQLTKVEDAS